MEQLRSRCSRYPIALFAIVCVRRSLRRIHYHLYERLCRLWTGGSKETLHLDAQPGYHSNVRLVLQATCNACAPYANVSLKRFLYSHKCIIFRRLFLCYNKAMLRTVSVTRYVTPLREGGSLPAIVEADDDGLYVLKFRGAGQGPLALIAELIAGEIGRLLGLPVPEIVFTKLDGAIGRN